MVFEADTWCFRLDRQGYLRAVQSHVEPAMFEGSVSPVGQRYPVG